MECKKKISVPKKNQTSIFSFASVIGKVIAIKTA